MTITFTKGEREPIPDDDDERYVDIAEILEDDASPTEAEIDADHDGEPDGYAGELVPFEERVRDPWAPSPMRGPLARFANRALPTPRQLVANTRWWGSTLSRAGVQLLIHAPELLLYQIPHVLRGLGKWGHTYANWRLRPDWYEAAKQADPAKRADKIAEVERRKRAATRATWIVVALTLGGSYIAYLVGYGWHVLAAAILVLMFADMVGRKGAPVSATIEIMPRSAFREGAPSDMVIKDVKAVLTAQGHDPETTAVVEPQVGQYGLSLMAHSQREISEKDVEAIERGLQTYRGAVNIIADPKNAAVSNVRIWWKDPLAVSHLPERLPPNSGSIAELAELGYGVGSVPLTLIFMRTNIGIIGKPGSGKSSTLWTCIDWLSTRTDVVLHGIDLSGGPALTAWGDVFATLATDEASAERLLRQRIDSAIARTHVLADRSRPRPGMLAPKSENWTPQDAAEGRGKFHILVVDELPVLANYPDLVAMFQEHQRIGRKAGETSLWAAQDITKDTIGATGIRKYPSTLILHACSRDDATQALGGGKIQEGWTPHRFTPAEGDNPNDAGKAFISGGGGHNKPVPWRFNRLDDLGEIHSRAIERIEAGRPVDDADPDDAIEGKVIPPILGALAAVFRAAGEPKFLPTKLLLERLREVSGEELTEIQLANAIREAVKDLPEEQRFKSDKQRYLGEAARGYHWHQISGAIDAL